MVEHEFGQRDEGYTLWLEEEQAKAWKKLRDAHPEGFPSQWVEDTPEWHTARKFIEAAHEEVMNDG